MNFSIVRSKKWTTRYWFNYFPITLFPLSLNFQFKNLSPSLSRGHCWHVFLDSFSSEENFRREQGSRRKSQTTAIWLGKWKTFGRLGIHSNFKIFVLNYPELQYLRNWFLWLIGNVEFKTALDTLKIFERRVSTLEEETNRISKAKLALDLDDNSKETIKPILNAIGQEILDLKSVWTELSESWKAVDELKETLWSAVVPRKVRRALEDIIARLKQLPNRIRQYQAFHHVQKQIKGSFTPFPLSPSLNRFLSDNHQRRNWNFISLFVFFMYTGYLKVNGIITELRSEALKDRHWKALKKRLNTNWIFSELTLGNLWDSDIQKNEAIYKEIITQAQGELALEEFLKQVPILSIFFFESRN